MLIRRSKGTADKEAELINDVLRSMRMDEALLSTWQPMRCRVNRTPVELKVDGSPSGLS